MRRWTQGRRWQHRALAAPLRGHGLALPALLLFVTSISYLL